jgi:predicted regulator of Ras-like GTPase activity (Roadblock/LC7/MglB family)
MPSTPQLLEEDVQEINGALTELLANSQASAALVAAEGGFVIFAQGETAEFNKEILGALAANAFSATQAMANVLDETSFGTVYQQGRQRSLLISQVNRQHTLIVVFPASTSVGAVKYFAAFTVRTISAQLARAKERAPEEGLDLALLNMADATEIFRSKQQG